MKKTKKQELSKDILNNEELSILKGGYIAVRNVNKFATCNCDYKDSCGLTNKNTVSGCGCTCV